MSRTQMSDDDVTEVFGLTTGQLRPIVESLAGEPVATFEIRIEHQLRGHRGYGQEKLIPTFAYATCSGRAGRGSVFVKTFEPPDPGEARHYRWLAEHQAPIPRMYGALTGPEGGEMIFIEYLETIDDLHPFDRFRDNAALFHQFLDLAARLNAIRPTEAQAAGLSHRDLAAPLAEALSALEDIWSRACAGELGEPVRRLCAGAVEKLPGLRALGGRLADPIRRMKTGLNHNDLYPDSTGVRRQTGELLATDLESVGIAPRFYDVARWLGAPDAVQRRCRWRDQLARYYLKRYAHWGGAAVPLDEFRRETRILWLAQTLSMLWFTVHRALDGRVDWTDDREEGRRVFRDDLYRQLRGLLRCAAAAGGRTP